MFPVKDKTTYKEELINILGSLLINIDQNYKKEDAGLEFIMDLEEKADKLRHYILEKNEAVINLLYLTLLDSINYVKSEKFKTSPYENKMLLISRVIDTLNKTNETTTVIYLEDVA